MPRLAKPHQAALCYLVTNHSAPGMALFPDDEDRTVWVELARQYADRYRAQIYHWACLNDGYGMVLEIPHSELAHFVGGLQQSYSRRVHERHGSSGPVWAKRFDGKPVEQGSVVALCGRHVERMPVRDGHARHALDHRWSSARYYVFGSADPLTSPNPYIDAPERTEERKAYGLALSDMNEENRFDEVNHALFIGAPSFGRRLSLRRRHMTLKTGRPAGTSPGR